MAHAWAHIERLIIKGPATHHAVSNPSIMALLPLSRHCPRLNVLALTVDTTRLNADHLARTPRVIHTVLTTAHFGHSAIEKPVEVAAFLSSMFPCLQDLRASPTHGGKSGD
ncbi:hypothetical protein C8F04DRAFT_1267421 [Mycena alexandri]|uniref:Uncharacterized protein n=1 Tax=Mycena alexandri TaxID=1745969 RepID=A0AAD6WZV9_9AGAR|nr:hypothetical protein C8F04DRAFT_1267421 [Mycena alexandri]